ncbi:glycosyltransferase [Paenimyroides viscosum]|uniref:Glycosyltransferase n=1 Tax=Paenimyroides viscosum TaxID=2488729 RepID=A0A3P1AMQ6_9FLAO|nr:glycosyltransferase [Paenimyroides viscosum]RRA90389.1 glycosyltransferase [Paenimyroides viscosum]
MKHILIFEHDILKYPPILSVINYLFYQKKDILLIGYCSSEDYLNDFKAKGGIYINVIVNNIDDNPIIKTAKYFTFKKKVHNIVEENYGSQTKLWLFGEQCIWLLHRLVYKYESNLYLFEMPTFNVSFRYKLLSPTINYSKALNAAKKVVCCEYNRAHITKSFFQLEKLPIIIPNKPLINDDVISNKYIKEFTNKVVGKKIILYQGIFNYPERKLDDFCESIKYLSNDFIICLMGSDNDYKRKLKSKYESERILFLPYIPAPHHLSITKLAHIGLLVYNAEGQNIENTLNTLYCAPNKIFEYSKYGIPMVSNDIPALKNIFTSSKCGIAINSMDGKSIAEAIMLIDANYDSFSKNSDEFFNSTDMNNLYYQLI